MFLCWVQTYIRLLFIFGLILWLLCRVLLCCDSFYFEVSFVWYEYCYFRFLLISIYMNYFPLLSVLCVFKPEMGSIDSIYIDFVFVSNCWVCFGWCFKPIWLPWWLRYKASVYNVGDPDLIPGSGNSLGEGNGNPLQYYCLENPMGREAW